MKNKKLRILTIGGGSGQYTLLSGLRDIPGIDITSVVSMVDNGGSTGRLRDELGVLPPGDALKCVIALSPYREFAHNVLLKKLNGYKRLQGHNAGNLLLTIFSQYTDSFPTAIQTLSDILEIRGRVLPGTTNKATLAAELADGSRIYGESAIDIPGNGSREHIKEIFLVPHFDNKITVYPPVIEAILNSDYILLGPGDLFTSILANLIVPGIKTALQETQAKIIYVVNIMTKFGETHNFKSRDFVQKVEEYLGRQVDGIIGNTGYPGDKLLERYRAEKAELVELEKPEQWLGGRDLYSADLLDSSDQIVRHDPKKLASLIQDIIG